MDLQSTFNSIPYIDISKSSEFKKRAEDVLKTKIPNWVENYYREYDPDKSEDDPINELINYSKIRNLQSYYWLKDKYNRVELPPQVVYHILTEVFKRVVIYTNKDLVDQIKRASVWIDSKVTKYSGIMEFNTSEPNKIKSKDWILHEAMRYIHTPPECLIQYTKVKEPGEYLIMDDAIYSGTQVSFDLLTIINNTPKCVIYVAAMYIADIGLETIDFVINKRIKGKYVHFENGPNEIKYLLYTNKELTHEIYIWTGYIRIPSMDRVLMDIASKGYHSKNVKSELSVIKSELLNTAASIVIFEHRLPDYKSLPEIVANVFTINMPDHYINMPPYRPAKGFIRQKVSDYRFDCFSFGRKRSGVPVNKKLYESLKKKVKARSKVWPSAYASGQLVRLYKSKGGKYRFGSLDRWFKEKWVDVCKPKKNGRYQPCGRSRSSRSKYPYCRPLKRINAQTPKTVGELTQSQRKKYCRIKRKNPYSRLPNAFGSEIKYLRSL